MTSSKTQKIYGGFNRLRDFPIDPSSVWTNKHDLEDYLANNKTAYAGQICVITEGPDIGLYEVRKGQEGSLNTVLLAKDEDVVKNASKIVELEVELAAKDAEVQRHAEEIAAISSSLANDYVKTEELDSAINQIFGVDREHLKDDLNDIRELSDAITELLDEIKDKIDADVVSARFDTFLQELRRIDQDRAALSRRHDQEVINIHTSIDDINTHLADTDSRILTDDDVVDIVKDRALDKVHKVAEFNFRPGTWFDSSATPVFAEGDVISAITITYTTAPNSNTQVQPYIISVDNSGNSINYMIPDADFYFVNNEKTPVFMSCIDYKVKKPGNFGLSVYSSETRAVGRVTIEYFSRA